MILLGGDPILINKTDLSFSICTDSFFFSLYNIFRIWCLVIGFFLCILWLLITLSRFFFCIVCLDDFSTLLIFFFFHSIAFHVVKSLVDYTINKKVITIVFLDLFVTLTLGTTVFLAISHWLVSWYTLCDCTYSSWV